MTTHAEQTVPERLVGAPIKRVEDPRLFTGAAKYLDDLKLRLADLYRENGAYTYKGGWNWRAVVATLAGCFFAWIGLFVKSLHPLYDYAWFVGFGTAAVVHGVLMKALPPAPALEPAAA